SSKSPFQVTMMPLELNSLYICTLPIPTNIGSIGAPARAFHWGLVHVDSAGHCSLHEWAEDPVDGTECYQSHNLPDGAMPIIGSSFVVGYFKIPGYTDTSQVVDRSHFEAVCDVCEEGPRRLPVVNRAHGISCRTFVRQVVAFFTDQDRAVAIENRV
ncbi:hypothetical protein R3P38DRAFT_2458247, partial [Favolaschia claudopus]